MHADIHLLRHAETPFNLNPEKIGGQSSFLDTSERGNRQMECLGDRLFREGIKFEEVHSSPALRTSKTAQKVCQILNYPIDKILSAKELLEISLGDWEGRLRAELHTPEMLERMQREHWKFKAPNGESQEDVETRVYKYIEDNIINKNKEGNFALFTHGVTTKCLLRRILNSDPRLTYKFSIDNCSITQVRYIYKGQHQGWNLIKINDNAHLAECGFHPEIRN